MKIPLNWLNEFVDLKNLSIKEIIENLTLKVSEVDSYDEIGKTIKGPLIAAKILEIKKHPNADKLQITQVQINEKGETLQIVCGAKNIKEGQIVPLALVGAEVINRKTNEKLFITKNNIRDIESNGMLCSASELGIDGDSEGIHILPENLDLGLDLIDYLNLKSEIIINIECKSNRDDLLCVQGIARETATAIDSTLKLDYYKQDYNKNFIDIVKNLPKNICKIESLDLCKGLVFFKIKNIKISQSSQYIKEKLIASGFNIVNNIVDILNFVMMEIGQPMHAYDSKKISDFSSLTLRKAKQKEIFLALDNNEYKLEENKSLVISDDKNILALAGVMGGAESAINDDTQEIILEIGAFTSADVRKTSRFCGLSSESSRRFERGSDPELIKIAFLRVLELIKDSCPDAEIITYSEFFAEENKENSFIDFDLNEYNRIMGEEIKEEKALKTLKDLGFKVEKKNNIFKVQIPSFRNRDIKRSIDLIEEIARFENLNNFKEEALKTSNKPINKEKPLENIKEILISEGYLECKSASLISEKDLNLNPIDLEIISMKNPISKDYAHLRNSLIPSLLNIALYNTNRQNHTFKLFEIAKIYGFDKQASEQDKNNIKSTFAIEQEVLGLLISFKNQEYDWQGKLINSFDYFTLKGLIELLAYKKGNLIFKTINSDKLSFLHPNIASEIIFNNKSIGFIGKLHPLIAQKYEISKNTFIGQINLENLKKQSVFRLKKLNNILPIQKDLTLDLEINASSEMPKHADIEALITRTKLTNLDDFKFLTLYEKNNIRSLSYRLYFLAKNEAKLTNEEINAQIEILKIKLKEKFLNISFRS